MEPVVAVSDRSGRRAALSRRGLGLAFVVLALLPAVRAGATDVDTAPANAAPAANPAPDFANWLQGLRQDALAAGIRPATVARALDGLEPIPRVIELDQRQPEQVRTYGEYLSHVVSPERRKAAREQLAANRALLNEVARRYGVQPRFIVALWGIETSFGAAPGRFPIIASLATLAYEGRRGAFFRRELIDALKIVDADGLDPAEMTGSWAGAMGQTQFMPSTFLSYAVSFSGDGRRDIWRRREDVFASMANYLSRLGWSGDETWGRAVRLPARFNGDLVGLTVKKKIRDWRALGVRRSDGGPLPVKDIEASVLRPGGDDGPSLLVYDNFRALLKWNNSSYFASAVGFLADSVDRQ
jgi:membrane-bound lytic murein transglycosylase B